VIRTPIRVETSLPLPPHFEVALTVGRNLDIAVRPVGRDNAKTGEFEQGSHLFDAVNDAVGAQRKGCWQKRAVRGPSRVLGRIDRTAHEPARSRSPC
jgi:hypothetical protein